MCISSFRRLACLAVGPASPRTLGRMKLHGPVPDASATAERILRTLPDWFGIEESLLEYVQDTRRYHTFVAIEPSGREVAFLTLRQHFERTWEVHCIAVEHSARNQGIGKALHQHVEDWLVEQGASFLQVKTMSAASGSSEYEETREFYLAIGYQPLEEFPLLWGPQLPVLQLVKALPHAA